MKLSVRAFIATAVAAALVTGCSTTPSGVGTGRSHKGPTGLQLYSLRGHFTKNVQTSLDIVKNYGIREVELAGTYNIAPAEFKKQLDARGLTAIGSHFPYSRFRDDPEGIARDAKALGLKYAGCAWIDHKDSFDATEAREAAAVFNRAGEILAKDGIKCFYHCHGYEFESGAAGPGTTAMDILMQETNPKNVCFEMDILWVVFPGQDPAQWLMKYPGRWHLIHLKDLKKGVSIGDQSGKTDPNNDVVLGTGQMNWPSILAAAKKSGVKYYFIEDESAGAVDQVPQSLRFLENLRF